MDVYCRIYNSPDGVGRFSTVSEQMMAEKWEQVLSYKKRFLTSQKEDPREFPYFDKTVASSWVRARSREVDPYKVVKKPQINNEALQEIRRDSEDLINTTQSIIAKLGKNFCDCGYIFYLINPEGVILLHEGNWFENCPFPGYGSRIGIVANEETMGTNAHELCIRLKEPVQLLGPEHYLVAFQNYIASAAPILKRGQKAVAAVLLLSKPVIEKDDQLLFWQCNNELALVSSLALAIETAIECN